MGLLIQAHIILNNKSLPHLLMRRNCIPILAIVVALTLIGAGGVLTLQYQQHAFAFGFVERQQIGEFKKLTHEFEKAVVGDPNISQGPAPHLRELLDAYAQDVRRIFLGGPDTIPELLATYQQDVLAVFQAPPEPEKQAHHDQIKEFKQLTHDFIKDIVDAASQPPPDDG